MSKDTQPREIKRVGVIGAGTMGGGIAMNFANAGIPVTHLETDAGGARRAAWRRSSKNYKTSATRGGMKAEDVRASAWR